MSSDDSFGSPPASPRGHSDLNHNPNYKPSKNKYSNSFEETFNYSHEDINNDEDNENNVVGGSINKLNLKCRMYEQKYPEVDDLVMVSVRSIADMGAYVFLLEYNNIEGMILLSELSRRRIRSISKLVRVGRQEVVVVLRVDKEKGYIDLSKRRVSPEDINKCEEKYNKSKAVHSIMRHVAEVTQTDLEELYRSVGWPLYKKYGHAVEAFKLAITDPESVFAGLEVAPEVMEVLLKDIKRRLTPQAMKFRADVEVTCFNEQGINGIKAALTAGQAHGSPDFPVKIKLVAPPFYVIMTTSHDKEKGITLLTEAIDIVKTDIEARGGNLIVKNPPRATSEREDKELASQLVDLENRNKEVSGDDDDDDEEEEEEEEDEQSSSQNDPDKE